MNRVLLIGKRAARVDAGSLRHLTDDSGGRTEVVRSALDLDSATAGIADELSQQYYLGYVSDAKKDGRRTSAGPATFD